MSCRVAVNEEYAYQTRSVQPPFSTAILFNRSLHVCFEYHTPGALGLFALFQVFEEAFCILLYANSRFVTELLKKAAFLTRFIML